MTPRAAVRPGAWLVAALLLLGGGVLLPGGGVLGPGGLAPAGPALAAAQEPGAPVPLTKSDLTRMLVGTTYTPEEVARIVSRSCLSFEPTERDLQDFRRVGATDEVVDAVRDCRGRTGPLTVQLASTAFSVQTGNAAVVQVQLRQGEEPAAGVRVVLEGSEQIAGAGGNAASAVTDEEGRATLRVPGGSSAARYPMRVVVPGRDVQGTADLVLAVQAPPTEAEMAAAQPQQQAPAQPQQQPPASPQQQPPAQEPEAEEREPEPVEEPIRREAEERQLDERPPPARAERRPSEPATTPVAEEDSNARVALSLGQASLRAGDAAAAVVQFQRATAAAPEDGQAWLGLGRALAATGRYGDARQALRRSAELDSSLEPQVRTELSRLPLLPPEIEASVWGGATYEGGGVSELVFAEFALRPVDFVRIFGRYDGGLDLELPALVRGRGSPRAVAGGAAFLWGEDDRLRTLVEAGRRESQDGLLQYTYRAQQRVRMGNDESHPVLEFAGFLGRWYDRDDWLVQAAVELPVLSNLVVRPGLSAGETVGSAFDEVGRRPAREARAEIGALVWPVADVILMPSISIGIVDDVELEESGTLSEGRLRVEAPLQGGLHLQGFLRHQRPPFSEAFTSVAVGLRVGVAPIR